MPFKPLYATWVIKSLGTLQQRDENLSDLKIYIGASRFYCHRFHLCACSEFFRVLLGVDESKDINTKPAVAFEPGIVLTIKGIEPETFENILHSIYRAEENLTEQNMIDTWHAVSNLQINFLVSECEEFIISKISLGNYLDIYKSAVLLKSEKVLTSLYPFLVKHYRDFITSQTFVAMSLECFVDFLKECGSTIQPPDQLVESIIKWVSHVPETTPGHDNGKGLTEKSDTLKWKKRSEKGEKRGEKGEKRGEKGEKRGEKGDNRSEKEEQRSEKDEKRHEKDDESEGKQPRKPVEVVFEKFHGKDGIKPKPIDAVTRRSHVGTLLKETDLALVGRDCLRALLENDIVMECRDAREFVNKTVAMRIEAQLAPVPKVTEKPNARYYSCTFM